MFVQISEKSEENQKPTQVRKYLLFVWADESCCLKQCCNIFVLSLNLHIALEYPIGCNQFFKTRISFYKDVTCLIVFYKDVINLVNRSILKGVMSRCCYFGGCFLFL